MFISFGSFQTWSQLKIIWDNFVENLKIPMEYFRLLPQLWSQLLDLFIQIKWLYTF